MNSTRIRTCATFLLAVPFVAVPFHPGTESTRAGIYVKARIGACIDRSNHFLSSLLPTALNPSPSSAVQPQTYFHFARDVTLGAHLALRWILLTRLKFEYDGIE